MEAFLSGIVAGYGIAIPVGAIAILLVEVSIRCGFWCGASAGAGAATADLLYSVVAIVGGASVARAFESVEDPFRYVSAAVLILLALSGLRRARSEPAPIEVELPSRTELAGTYARFLGLTIINPLTVLYFVAFIVGLGLADDLSPAEGVLFAVGAFLASLSWQTLLAGVGSVAGRKLSPQVRTGAVIFGNLLVLGFAIAILMR